MVKVLRIGVIALTGVYLVQRLLLETAASSRFGWGEAFNFYAGRFFGWKIAEAFRFEDGWGKTAYVFSLLVNYGLLALCAIAIVGMVQDARPSPLPEVSPTGAFVPPGIAAGLPSDAPPGAAAATPARQQSAGTYETLEQIHRLHSEGALTDEEFDAEKRKLLS